MINLSANCIHFFFTANRKTLEESRSFGRTAHSRFNSFYIHVLFPEAGRHLSITSPSLVLHNPRTTNQKKHLSFVSFNANTNDSGYAMRCKRYVHVFHGLAYLNLSRQVKSSACTGLHVTFFLPALCPVVFVERKATVLAGLSRISQTNYDRFGFLCPFFARNLYNPRTLALSIVLRFPSIYFLRCSN